MTVDLNKEFNGLEGLEVHYHGKNLPLAETETKWRNFYKDDKYTIDDIIEIQKNGVYKDGTGIKIGIGDTGLGQRHLGDGGDLEGASLKNFTSDRSAYDRNSHGSHVTCVMAAKKQGSGITGLCNGAQVYHAKVLSDAGSGTTRGILNGVEWLAKQGCKVINLSLGGGSPSQYASDFYKELDQEGILVFASIGNSGQGGERGGYPGRYSSTIGIGAVNFDKSIAGFSSESANVDLVHTGVNIYSCSFNGYTGMSGTSMSGPIAAANGARHVVYFDHLGIKVKNKEHYLKLVQPAIEDLSTPGKDRYFGLGIINETKLIEKYGLVGEKPKDPVDPVDPVDPIEPPVECPVVEAVGSIEFKGEKYKIIKG